MTGVDPSGDLLAPHDWTFPVPISYGPGRLAGIGSDCRRLGIARPLIVTDRASRDLPFVGQVQDHLSQAGIPSVLWSDASPNPRDDEVGAGRAAFLDGGHDALIGIGGGSAMDTAKAIGLTAWNNVDLWDFDDRRSVPDCGAGFPRLITIPTTAGTGAETESTAMITHVRQGMKFCIWHPDYKPALALLDPDLTLNLPASLTAWTGMDALTHAIEAYLVPDLHPLCDGAALQALSLIARWLPVAHAQPENLQARGGMLLGSCLAGVAFLKGLGLVHAISHMVGAEFDTQHGLTNAIILPTILRFNLPGQPARTARMCQAIGLSDTTPDALIAKVERLEDALDIPRSLSDIGVPEDCARRIGAKAIKDSAARTNPRNATPAQIADLTLQAIRKAR